MRDGTRERALPGDLVEGVTGAPHLVAGLWDPVTDHNGATMLDLLWIMRDGRLAGFKAGRVTLGSLRRVSTGEEVVGA